MLSEDPEIAKIMQKKLEAMINQKPQPKVEPGIIDLNDSNFEQTISSENLTLVDFWAEWCGPCKQIGPTLEEISNEMVNEVVIAKHNIDNEPKTFFFYLMKQTVWLTRSDVTNVLKTSIPQSFLHSESVTT